MSRIWRVVAILVMLFLSLWFLSGSGLIHFSPIVVDASSFPHLQSLVLNRQGNRQLEAQNFTGAFEAFVQTLKFEPFSPEIHLNLGLTYEGQQQPQNAMPSYKNALKYAQTDEMKFMAYFNQAQLLGKEKKIDEALELYQKALGVDPTSKEVKTNIELLIQLQQQQQNGQGENKQQQQDQNQKNQDQKQQDQDQKNQSSKDQNQQNQDQKNQNQENQNQEKPKDPQDQDKKDQKEKPRYAPNQKYQPRPFKGEELSEGDVKKILGEIRQQEQKIRSEYNRKEVKEQPRDKDW